MGFLAENVDIYDPSPAHIFHVGNVLTHQLLLAL